MPPRQMYTQELADAVCARLAEGQSLRRICQDDDMPCTVTVMKWLRERPEFADQYARAREEQAESYADEIVQIADDEPDPAKARVRVDARKWVASKLKPKKYGERATVSHEGGATPIETVALTPMEAARRLAFILESGRRAMIEKKDD